MAVERIPLSDCRQGHLYRLVSRNLRLGVYDGKEGFVGIREKMGSRYLFTEYHWDQGPPYGTVHPLEDLGPIPDGVEIRERDQTIDQTSGRPVAFDRPVKDGGRGWFYLDSGEADPAIRPGSRVYRPLFELLEEREQALEPAGASWGELSFPRPSD